MGNHYQLQSFFTREPCVCVCWPIAQLQTHWSMTRKHIEFRILGVGNLEFTNRSLGEWKGWESSLHPLKWKTCKLQNQPPPLQKEINRTSKDLRNHHSKRWKILNFRGRRGLSNLALPLSPNPHLRQILIQLHGLRSSRMIPTRPQPGSGYAFATHDINAWRCCSQIFAREKMCFLQGLMQKVTRDDGGFLGDGCFFPAVKGYCVVGPVFLFEALWDLPTKEFSNPGAAWSQKKISLGLKCEFL